MKILMTGGPVFEYLDSVKIITNKFKGGRMAQLADAIGATGAEIYYLCSKESVKPTIVNSIIFHDGFEDYRDKVLNIAPRVDAVVLGAAVANLIPISPWKNTKFPSHQYKEGARINIEFMVAPRIINMVKPVSPKTILIGFKLLSNVSHEELIDAAYTTLVESNSNFVVANDATKLDDKFIVTKEKSEIPLTELTLPQFIVSAAKDKYYSTEIIDNNNPMLFDTNYPILSERYKEQINIGYDTKRDILFGCIAVRHGNGFIVSSRGKKNILETSYVEDVDHSNLKLKVKGEKKASINSPLIDKIFTMMPKVQSIVHYHKIERDLMVLPYAFPGTTKDSLRNIPGHSFCIDHHGTFLLLDKEGKIL